MDNHDEERLMFNNLSYGNASGSYSIKDTLTALSRIELAAVQFFGVPGPKMIYEFTETGYDYSILFNGDRVASKPVRWDYMDQPAREHLNRVVGAMAELRKSDAFRYGSFTRDLTGLGKRMWITHNSMDVVIALNMGVTGFDMAPGFTKNGTWYDYFTGESVNVTNASAQTLYFGPGEYKVFTTVPLPKPFYTLTVNVLDNETANPISGATVNLSNAGNRHTDALGSASFLSLPQPVVVTASKFGWITKAETATVSNTLEITIRMIKDESAVGEEEAEKGLRVYPNPTKGLLTVETEEPGLLQIFNLEGKPLLTKNQENQTESLDLSKYDKGVYVLRFEGKTGLCFRKIVIN
jgi:hypothetical protein